MIFICWAPQIFTVVFGARWLTAGIFAKSLILWVMISFCNVPAVLFGRIIRVQQKMFVYEMILLILRITTMVLGGLYLSATYTITLFSLVGAFMNFFLILIIGFLLVKSEKAGINAIMDDSKISPLPSVK